LWALKNYIFFKKKEQHPNDNLVIGRYYMFQQGSLVYNEKCGVFLSRDDRGLFAIENRCSHLGCRLKIRDKGLVCGCHNSRFNSSGEVLSGPAKMPLQRFHIKRGSNNLLIVDKNKKADLNFRYTE
jgi:Rieske Fe-S protein